MFDGVVDLDISQAFTNNESSVVPQQNFSSRVELSIPCAISYVAVARHAVDALSELLLFPPDDRAAIKLAVGEACNNAILHPASPTGGHAQGVTVVCRVLPDVLEIDVTNQGSHFLPPHGHKMPDPEMLSEHGRGLALMEIIMDSVAFISSPHGTTVRLRKKRP